MNTNRLPLCLEREQFDKLFPAVRQFMRYSYDQQSDLQASRRLGHRQRQATGEFFYTHPLLETTCQPTRGRAQEMGWRRYQELEEAEWCSIAQSETTVIK